MFSRGTQVIQRRRRQDLLAEDVSLLQDDLDIVYDWTSINNMELNGKKFKHIAYGK